MSAEPNLKYMHPDSAEAKAAAAERLEVARRIERREWLALYRIMNRCVEIAETIWSKKLETASAQQQTLAEHMRDRSRPTGQQWRADAEGGVVIEVDKAEIPVPLFTPRDRVQFLKEVAATLMISADRRNLTVLFPKEPVEPEPQEEPDTEQEQLATAGERPADPNDTAPLALGVEQTP